MALAWPPLHAFALARAIEPGATGSGTASLPRRLIHAEGGRVHADDDNRCLQVATIALGPSAPRARESKRRSSTTPVRMIGADIALGPSLTQRWGNRPGACG